MSKEVSETSQEIFKAGYNCAQSVLRANCDTYGLDDETALRISSGFGAGIARAQEVCGAVTGGTMVLGLKYGIGKLEPEENNEKVREKTRNFIEEFTKNNGSIRCKELLKGIDLNTQTGQTRFKEEDLFNKTCLQCVKNASEIIRTL